MIEVKVLQREKGRYNEMSSFMRQKIIKQPNKTNAADVVIRAADLHRYVEG
ncbi:hypothetical protein ES705_42304 [subsurface metagenome]